ncbi:MAG: threonylcarbamoyl-AMP synthase [Desulfomonile tiedjei]|nr:threonylcarbamoyl-AMP synthase [Desulfomonile tiedjei]
MKDDEHESLLDRAAEVIRSGGLVIVPTETFYALAADPFQEGAVRRVFQAKLRDESMPLPLIAADRGTVDKVIANLAPLTKRLMDSFWPGSLTILLEVAIPVFELLRGPSGKIGVRVPPPCPARTLAERVGGWITATSANLSGHANPKRLADIAREVQRAADMVLDLGPAPGGKPSTVVEPVGESLRVIREGAISLARIRDAGFNLVQV